MKRNLFFLIFVLSAGFIDASLYAEQYGPPVPELLYANSVIVPADGNWTADLSTKESTWEDIYLVDGTGTEPNTWPPVNVNTFADVMYRNSSPVTYPPGYSVEMLGDIVARSALLGFPDGGSMEIGLISGKLLGTVIYRFAAPQNYKFTGGTVHLLGSFYGTPSTQGIYCWMGVGTQLEMATHSVLNPEDFNKITAGGSAVAGTYPLDWTLDIPTETRFFYLVAMSNILYPTASSAYIGYNSLEIQNATFAKAYYPCGEEGTVYLPGDLNKDCYIDMVDLAEFLEDWLECTDPVNEECDENY